MNSEERTCEREEWERRMEIRVRLLLSYVSSFLSFITGLEIILEQLLPALT